MYMIALQDVPHRKDLQANHVWSLLVADKPVHGMVVQSLLQNLVYERMAFIDIGREKNREVLRLAIWSLGEKWHIVSRPNPNRECLLPQICPVHGDSVSSVRWNRLVQSGEALEVISQRRQNVVDLARLRKRDIYFTRRCESVNLNYHVGVCVRDGGADKRACQPTGSPSR